MVSLIEEDGHMRGMTDRCASWRPARTCQRNFWRRSR